jgi:predicted MFS family arabinose efflux permease
MALIGAAFGIGFTLGPVLGWLTHDYIGPEWPGMSAALLSSAALLCAWRMLPEPERRAARQDTARFAALAHVARHRQVLLIVALQFAATFAFAALEGTLALLTKREYGLGFRGTGLLFTYIGFCLLVAQGALVRRLMPRVGERMFARVGAFCLCAGLALVPLVGSGLAGVLPVLAVTVFGFAMLTPSLSSLLSLHTPEGMQGDVLGIGQSSLSLAPFLGNIVFARDPALPYWGGAALMLLAAAATLALPGRPSDVPGPSDIPGPPSDM